MERVRIDRYIPRWDAEGWKEGVYRRYATKLIRQNLWKYANIGLTEDDLLQEAWIVFDFCVKKYTVKNPMHFMALYKKKLFCAFWLLAKASSKENKRVRDEDTVQDALDHKGEHEYNNGPLKILLEKAPQEIKDVLEAIVNAPAELVDGLIVRKNVSNRQLKKLLGYDPKESVCKALKRKGYDYNKLRTMSLAQIFQEYFTGLDKI